MIFKPLTIQGVVLIELDKVSDHRGGFLRVFCKDEFMKNKLDLCNIQTNLSFNEYKHTLRGLHYQIAPFEESKLVMCIQGSAFDVVVDMRPESTTYKQHLHLELSSDISRMVYIPTGCAHGFQSLEDKTTMLYHMSQVYYPDCAKGIRWNDPSFNIKWPCLTPTISDKDCKWPLW